jgi:hypothetical protein
VEIWIEGKKLRMDGKVRKWDEKREKNENLMKIINLRPWSRELIINILMSEEY